MKQHRTLFVLVLVLIVSLALVVGCSTRSVGDNQGSDQVGGEGEGGALDEIDLSEASDQEGGEGEEGALDEIDLSQGCPVSPVEFELTLDYQINVKDDSGYMYERTDPNDGVVVVIHDSTVEYPIPDDTISVTIEGKEGPCTISGMAEISFVITGDCETGVATLDITGTYDIYHRELKCPGQPTKEYTDSVFAGPGINAEFNISEAGDSFDLSQKQGDQFEFVYKWTLKPSAVGANPLVP